MIPDEKRSSEGNKTATSQQSTVSLFDCCQICRLPIRDTYYKVSGRTVCTTCKWEAENTIKEKFNQKKIIRSICFGIATGLLGLLVFFGLLGITGYHASNILVLFGILVGLGVRFGCKRKGGWLYQGIAIILTYIFISATFIPSMVQTSHTGEDTWDLSFRSALQIETSMDSKRKTIDQPGSVSSTVLNNKKSLFIFDAALKVLPTVINSLYFILSIILFPFVSGQLTLVTLASGLLGLTLALMLNRTKKIDISGPYGLSSELVTVRYSTQLP